MQVDERRAELSRSATCPLRSTSITPASALLQGSPPLSGASVLSALRLEPLAPCMGLFLSRSFGTPAHLDLSSVSLFDLEARFFVPTRTSLTPARAEAVKVGRRTNLTACPAVARPHLDSFEHDGTLGAVGMAIRGELAFGFDSEHGGASGSRRGLLNQRPLTRARRLRFRKGGGLPQSRAWLCPIFCRYNYHGRK